MLRCVLSTCEFLMLSCLLNRSRGGMCTLSAIIKIIWRPGAFHRYAAKMNAHNCVYTNTQKKHTSTERQQLFIFPPTVCSNWPSGTPAFLESFLRHNIFMLQETHLLVHMQCKVRYLWSVYVYSMWQHSTCKKSNIFELLMLTF